MSRFFASPTARMAILLFGLAMAGCAAVTPVDIHPEQPQSAGIEGTQNAWWFVRINWRWLPETSPDWHLDLLAAHQIVLPVVNTYRDDLVIWRMHRRAARDQAGHQFSFIFFAPARTAHHIYEDIAAGPLLADLIAAGVAQRIQTSPLSAARSAQIADTSDPAWSTAMQASWPYYISGVSQMWLNLVSFTANRMLTGSEPETVAETIELYRRVDEEVTRHWQEEGRHALLHHLNAVFGYRPVPVIEKKWLNF